MSRDQKWEWGVGFTGRSDRQPATQVAWRVGKPPESGYYLVTCAPVNHRTCTLSSAQRHAEESASVARYNTSSGWWRRRTGEAVRSNDIVTHWADMPRGATPTASQLSALPASRRQRKADAHVGQTMLGEWETAHRCKAEVRRLLALANALADQAEHGTDEWHTWLAAAEGLDALLWLHERGCVLAHGDPRASDVAMAVLLDPMPEVTS